MTNETTHFDVCSVMNNRQTGEMKLQVETHSHSVSNVSLDSEKVEGLCFPLLFCHEQAILMRVRVVEVQMSMQCQGC